MPGPMVSPPQPKRLGYSASEPQFQHSFDDGEPQQMSTRPGIKGREALATASTTALALYATPSYGALYVEPEDLEPGPGAYDLTAGFGPQQLSDKHSEPAITLTAKHEKSWEKVMITKAHLNVLKGRGTPGPGRYEPEPVKSQSRVRFGTSTRNALCDEKLRAPGPIYDVRTLPEQIPKRTKFAKGTRFERDGDSIQRSLGNTGPGMYEIESDFDQQKKAKSFGCSHRAYDRVRFPGSERMMVGRQSPGPGAAQPFMNDGVQLSFGRAERLPGNAAAKRAPGPGAYSHDKPCPFSRSQSVYSFGRPHARTRLDHKQMRHLGNSTWGYN